MIDKGKLDILRVWYVRVIYETVIVGIWFMD